MSDRDSLTTISFRVKESTKRDLEAVAEGKDMGISRLMRDIVQFAIASNAEMVSKNAEIESTREEIIERNAPIDKAGGFAGRCRSQFMERLQNGYRAKWLIAKAESYREEARMLEDLVGDHPHAPPIEDGELVAEVDRVLRDALEAMSLSDWGDRYQSRFHALQGVEEGREAKEFALVVLRNAVEMDVEMEPLASHLGTERRVRADDLPALADDDLPPTVDRADVVDVARSMSDDGVLPEDVPTDPEKADPFGLADDVLDDVEAMTDTSEVASASSDSTTSVVEAGDDVDPELPDAQPVESTVTDGGGNTAIQAFNEDNSRNAVDLVEWAAEILRDAAKLSKSRSLDGASDVDREDERQQQIAAAEDDIRRRIESSNERDWKSTTMDQTTLTLDDLIEAAHDYNSALDATLTGPRETPPEVVDDANGGVRIE